MPPFCPRARLTDKTTEAWWSNLSRELPAAFPESLLQHHAASNAAGFLDI